MKAIKYILAGGLALFAIWFLISTWRAREAALDPVHFTDAGDNESYAHKIKRYRAGADAALLPAITNAVVGLRTILDRHTETYDDNFAKWTAEATVEFINQQGGVERKIIQFKFGGYGGEPSWDAVPQ